MAALIGPNFDFFLFFTHSYNFLLGNKVWSDEDFFSGHKEHFRIPYAFNEMEL